MDITLEKIDLVSIDEKMIEKNDIFTEMWKESWEELLSKGALAPEIPPINKLGGVFFLLKADNVPVGIRVYYKITSDFYDSYLTYVKPDFREQRIAITTRQMAFDELKKLGIKKLTTIVSISSQEMIQNFKSLGIEPSAYRYEWDI